MFIGLLFLKTFFCCGIWFFPGKSFFHGKLLFHGMIFFHICGTVCHGALFCHWKLPVQGKFFLHGGLLLLGMLFFQGSWRIYLCIRVPGIFSICDILLYGCLKWQGRFFQARETTSMGGKIQQFNKLCGEIKERFHQFAAVPQTNRYWTVFFLWKTLPFFRFCSHDHSYGRQNQFFILNSFRTQFFRLAYG